MVLTGPLNSKSLLQFFYVCASVASYVAFVFIFICSSQTLFLVAPEDFALFLVIFTNIFVLTTHVQFGQNFVFLFGIRFCVLKM